MPPPAAAMPVHEVVEEPQGHPIEDEAERGDDDHRTAVNVDHGVASDQRHDDARGTFVQEDARSQPDDQDGAERAEHLQGRCGEM